MSKRPTLQYNSDSIGLFNFDVCSAYITGWSMQENICGLL